MGLIPCDRCGKACSSIHGIRTHKAASKCVDRLSPTATSLPVATSSSSSSATSSPPPTYTAPRPSSPSPSLESHVTNEATSECESLKTLLLYHHIKVNEKALRGQMASIFSDAAEMVATEFLKHPTEKTLLNFLLLPKAGLGLGLMEADKPTNVILKEFPMIILTPPDREKKTSKKLEGKHPRGRARAFSTTSNPRAGPSPSNDDLMEALRTFPTDTAPGLSGWTIELDRMDTPGIITKNLSSNPPPDNAKDLFTWYFDHLPLFNCTKCNHFTSRSRARMNQDHNHQLAGQHLTRVTCRSMHHNRHHQSISIRLTLIELWLEKNLLLQFVNRSNINRVHKVLPWNKSPGPSGVEYAHYKASPTLQRMLVLLLRITIVCMPPDSWKHLLTVPIFKNKGSPTDLTNYRLIGLLEVERRIFEKLMVLYISDRNILPATQCGFRKQHSTFTAVLTLDHIMRKRRQKGKRIGTTFVDVKAAFDGVYRPYLWDKVSCPRCKLH
ncbi:hypothetical protein SeMB42_g06309 [Synchytrium endobioticum]|uniref:Reverse transcriptase domain-containing protein n=1 Tax=Synchytrium endobioticum TaxID=286115 RepID=A0A507CJD6_9FUNG|nr:hypothetical protein SeMB42_g06309 [Synchytrium endobioticum]